MANVEKLWELVKAASALITDAAWKDDYKELLKMPVNHHVTPEAEYLLAYLYGLQGKAILSGQHEYLEAPSQFVPYIYGQTGKYPKVKGVEFGAINGQTDETTDSQRDNVVNYCIQWHQQGGIITATYHATFPGMANTWENVQADCTPEQFEPIITPGTALYDALIEDIDQVAEHLKVLRDAGVPVLWRPYHEMNGTWFWWGGQPKYKELWEIMYDRYVNYHGLNNLLWVWSPNANNQWSDKAKNYYVGHDRVDALGMDIYDNDFSPYYHQELLRIGEGKIIAITENGQNPDPTKLRLKQSMYSWFLTWGSYAWDTSRNPTDKLIALYNDPFVITLDEVGPPENPVYPPDTTTGNGLWGMYYKGKNFETFHSQGLKPKIDYAWATSTPVGQWLMSANWSGYIKAKYTENVTLFTEASDGVRLYIDNKLIIDDWNVHTKTEKSATIAMEAGKYYYVTLEYFNNGDTEANVKLSWSSQSQAKEVIPTANLYSS